MWTRYRQALNLRADWRDIWVRPVGRNAMLDGVRAIGILLVILLHCCFGMTRIFEEAELERFIQSLPGWLDIAWQARGSDIIFVMCGLLVSLSLFREQERTGAMNVRRFYQRRLWRIVPMYVVGLVLYGLADTDRLIHFWSNILFITNLVDDQSNIIPVGWSMNIQMQFYLLLPAMIWLIHRNPWPATLLFAGVLIAVLIRYLAVMNSPGFYFVPFHGIFEDSRYANWYAHTLYYNLHTRIGPFWLGIVVAWLYQRRHTWLQHRFQRPVWPTVLSFGVGLLLLWSSVRIGIHDISDPFYQPFEPLRNLAYLVLNKYAFSLGVALILLSLLFPAGGLGVIKAGLSWRLWHPMAELIYGLYLYHFLFIVLAAVLVFGTTDREAVTTVHLWQIGLIFLLTLVFSLAFSALVYLFIEKPFIALGRQRRQPS